MKAFNLSLALMFIAVNVFSQTTNSYPPNGNVGIGTTTPQSKLHLVDGNGGEQIRISRGTGTIRFVQDVNQDNLYLLNSDGLKTYMFWSQNGNVGVGTNLPESKLHIADGIGGEQIKISRGAGAVRLVQDNNQDNLYLINRDGSKTYTYWAPSGNVGIGTLAPQQKLDINGALALRGQALIDVGANEIYIGDISSNEGLIDNLSFFTKDTRRMYIDGNGNVSIGTTDPKGYRLAVAGKAIAEEIVVKLQSNWPDYVFEKNYNLRPLAEVETYINQNKHLPEVPAAKEMEANGVNLGEMDMLLLKKVEELTLYVIALKKETDALRKQNELQQKAMELLEQN
jgi:hypothetical protein